MEDERRTEYDTEAVRLTDLQDDKIGPRAFEDLTFTNCYIRGPAVIPIEGIQLNGKIGIDFGGDPD